MKYVAFLRGINVGGHKTIRMEDLRSLFTSLDFLDVCTYIASGNVLFTSSLVDRTTLTKLIEAKIQDAYGFEVKIFIRTNPELQTILKNNPFISNKSSEGHMVYITFLYDNPDESKKSTLEEQSNDVFTFQIIEKELFVLRDMTLEADLFSNSAVEKVLGCPSTTRNLRTVEKIVAMCEK